VNDTEAWSMMMNQLHFKIYSNRHVILNANIFYNTFLLYFSSNKHMQPKRLLSKTFKILTDPKLSNSNV